MSDGSTPQADARPTPQHPPLRPVGTRPALPSYLRQVWQRRHFIYADSRARAFSGNRDFLLGNVWLIGRPILDGLIYFIIFGLILRTDRGIENFPGYLLIGVFLFSFTSRVTTTAVDSMRAQRNFLQSFAFPRASVPLAVLCRETVSMVPVLATLAVLLLVIPPRTSVTWTWLLFPAVFALHVLFNTGVALYAARLGTALPDLRFLITFVTRLWFYASGVMFSLEFFVPEGFWLSVLQANPLFLVLDISRDLLLYDTLPAWESWLVLAAWALVTPVLAFVYFWQGEETYAQQV